MEFTQGDQTVPVLNEVDNEHGLMTVFLSEGDEPSANQDQECDPLAEQTTSGQTTQSAIDAMAHQGRNAPAISDKTTLAVNHGQAENAPGPSFAQPPVVVKNEPVLLIRPCSYNNIELDDLLDDPEVEIDKFDDDITFIVNKRTGYAMPLDENPEGLVKYENDVVSGSMCFANTVRKILYNFQPFRKNKNKLICICFITERRTNLHAGKTPNNRSR